MEKAIALMIQLAMNKNLPKYFFSIILSFLLILSLRSNILAFSFYSTSTQKFDTSLLEETAVNYTNPEKIYVSQVSTTTATLTRNPAQWVKSLYYYCITRLYLPDLPYAYLLDENGIIYQGKSGYIGSNSGIVDGDGVILIGYLSNNPVLTTRAESSLYEIVEKLSSEWGISEVSTVRLKINKTEGSISSLTAEISSGELSESVKEALKNWSGHEKDSLAYKAEILNLEYPKEVEIGNRVKVKLSVKNMNDFVWFTNTDPIYVSVADGEDSEFAINKDWASFTKPVSITDKSILPGESIDLEFEMEAKIMIGEAKESFVVLKNEDKPFEDSGFDVKLNVTKGNNTLVEVASSEYGFANIRECKWFSCEILDTVDNGAVFILLEEADGWSKIKYGTETEGWVMSRFLKKI